VRRPAPRLAIVALALVASACLGGAAPAGPASTHSSAGAGERPLLIVGGPPRQATDVVVRYSVGGLARARSGVRARCPTLARCTPVPLRGSSPRLWVLGVARSLSCDPAAGAYIHPAAACRALRDLFRLESRKPRRSCMCALESGVPATATGTIAWLHVHLAADPCTACGLGGHAAADVRVLTAS
jgi:hypothetical protein